MNKMVKLSLAFLSLTCLTGAAEAAKQGAYVGGGLGYSRLNTPDKYLITDDSTKSFKQSRQIGGVAGRVFGGYNFNEYLGVEAGVAHLAPSTYESSFSHEGHSFKFNNEFSMMAGDLVGKAYLPLPDTGFNLYALGGIALVHSKVEDKSKFTSPYGSDASTVSKKQNKFRPKFGVGASYDIPDTQLTANVEWNRIQGIGNVKKNINAIPTSDMMTVNFSYKFD